jgi:SAM-dependent MidA family methyltransferase
MKQLSEIIIQLIHDKGPISFKDFMEMALYYPELGYYNSIKNKIGPEGDFYTSANVSDAFGAMIGRQIEEMWINLGKKPFQIVEYGAGTGLLCYDILNYLKKNKYLYNNVTYCIIEKSQSLREYQKKRLNDKVSWCNSIQELPKINGCILSNELIDNFAIHQVVMKEQLMEVYVDYTNGFVEILKPAHHELIDYFKTLNVTLPKEYKTEVNLESISWIKDIAQSLNKGYVITIDYGAESSQLYSKNRSCGTLLCYHKHCKNENPYASIGAQDITSHTNFSALSHWGMQYGLDFCGITEQTSFLLALGIKEYQNKTFLQNPGNSILAIQESIINFRLLMDMGMKFKVLIQEKNVSKQTLSGLKFCNLSKTILN